MKENFKILILTGVHGDDDGKVGENDYEFYSEDKDAIEWLKHKEKKDVIEQLKVTFEILNLGNFKENNEIDIRKLGRAVRRIRPNTLLLTFCFSSISELNRMLISEGIYPGLVLQEDRMAITGQR